MWQSVLDDVQGHDFVVLAVAMDSVAGARPWIEAAKPTYPCLIDVDHHLADLYHLVNVPQAVWIDETGRIVRPPHTAGSTDGFRRMDRTNFTMPEEATTERMRVKTAYFDAVRDWARQGSASAYALDPAQASERLTLPDESVAIANAWFQLGQQLLRAGNEGEAQRHFAQAARLHPQSWNIWRRTAAKDPRGLASGAEFWARVDALGDTPYYAPVDVTARR